MKTSQTVLRELIPHEKERMYYELKFEVPDGVCRIDIAYAYERHREIRLESGETVRREINIVDLALRDANGHYVGASGSDRSRIYVSAWESAQGYARTDTVAGEWAIIVGAYHIAPEGVEVVYTITFTYEARVLLRGDTHMHTLGSDGCMSVRDTAQHARQLGMDYIFITDHNNYAHNLSGPDVAGITVLPGMEWTHYDGHAGLLGVKRPLESAFCVNSAREAWNKLAQAREQGALVVLNHPFCPFCGWHFGMELGRYDLLEVVNGGTIEQANVDCLAWWQEQLCQGAQIPVVGGSDFHRWQPGRLIGVPTTAVYAWSRSPRRILDAIRAGNSFVMMQADGPTIWAQAGEAILGECTTARDVQIVFDHLHGGDLLRLITDQATEEICCGADCLQMQFVRTYPSARFCRFEVMRAGQRILISNPIYFEVSA